ncbi:MAG: RDD family protein [Burkholderiales bacterium]|nr:RDD family protein [Burkholderiales bacterium]
MGERLMLDGRLALTTPEGVSLALTPAGPGLRGFAWAIDFVVWVVSVSIVSMLLSFVFPDRRLYQGVFLLCLFVSYWGYPVLCEVYASGRTVGKRAMGLEVVREDGLPVGWRESATRNLLLAADFLPFLYAAGLVCMLCDTRFRRLGDIVAGTQVVYRPKPRKRSAVQSEQPVPLPYTLTPEQQRALLDFAERAPRLPQSRCIELADLAEPLTGLRGEASLRRLKALAAGLMGGL